MKGNSNGPFLILALILSFFSVNITDGLAIPCCISGYKYDTDNNPLDGWTINVKDGSGNVIRTAVTGDDGHWEICGLAFGTYQVSENLKDGWTRVLPTDPDYHEITLPGDCGRSDLDFVNERSCCISGYKYDTNNNPLEGWTINVKDGSGNVIRTAVTGDDGHWEICDLDDGTYQVSENLKDGWTCISPTDPDYHEITFPGDCGRSDLNFVNERSCCISGYKYDTDNNPLEGWMINVKDSSGNVIRTAVTGDDGHWEICDLDDGTYQVSEVLKGGWTCVSPTDPDYHEITLPGDCGRSDLNFVNGRDCCISGHKYDSITGEPLNDWRIFVDYNKNGEFDDGEPFNITYTDLKNGVGYWQICGLGPGNIQVCEVLKEGWNAVDPESGCQNVIIKDEYEFLTDIDFFNDPRNITIDKTADKYDVKRGEEVTYTITICNNGGNNVHNVTVWDVFNRRVEILSYSPAPGADGKWHFPVIPANTSEDITIKVRVPERQDFEFGMLQGVSGEGFVNVANDYSTTFEEDLLKNCAYVTSDWNAKPISDCVMVTVGELGTKLETREYGSGLFDAEERVAIFTENKSIEWEEDLSATYKPTSIGLYNNRIVTYDSAWVKKARAKNYVTGTTMTETYHDAVFLDRESRMFLDENQSVMEVDSEFDGRGHIGFLKMPSNSSTPQTTPIFEAREDYVGSFRVLERIDEYGSAVTSEKAASGEGLVVVDKKIGESQRSYESGAGTYDSEELIETYTNYIAKDIAVVYAPMNQSLTGDVSIEASMKWTEGMYSRNPETSLIGEEYTSITELDKETIAKGLNEMDTSANFSGRARYRAILEDEVDFDEQYEGDYSVERRVIFTGIAKYDRPHLNVTKTLVGGIVEETLPWGYGEEHLEGEVKTRTVATYTISIENDGNKALGPVYVQDLLPPGSIFIESSLRPTELTETYANWTLMNIGIGGVVEILLKLDVTKYHPSELVNRVKVCGGINNGDQWVCASNFSAQEISWVTCCIVPREEQLSVVKTAELDEVNASVVRYKVEVKNAEDVTRVATVTDSLPSGMKLIDSSIPFASYENGVVVWNLVEIKPFETKTIEFSALAPGDGRFTNTVEVDPRSVDGPVVQPVRATCVIEVGVVEDECGPISCGIWQPPNWELEHYGYGADGLACEDLTCNYCGGTESCLAP